MKKRNRVLIIGKCPPPLGGVRIHVARLLTALSRRHFDQFDFADLEKEPLRILLRQFHFHRVIHLHTSNPYVRLLIACICRLFRKRLLITYHGNIGRYSGLKAFAETLSVRLTTIPIVSNNDSFFKARSLNPQTVLIAAFIPPLPCNPLPEAARRLIGQLRSRYPFLLCTNASDLSFDKSGAETYGISGLIRYTGQNPLIALVISDPTCRYRRFIRQVIDPLPDNIGFITGFHDFIPVLQQADAFIRHTTTDGDSLSIHEALHTGLPVFATDVVSRPEHCITYRHLSTLEPTLMQALRNRRPAPTPPTADTVAKLTELYQKMLQQ